MSPPKGHISRSSAVGIFVDSGHSHDMNAGKGEANAESKNWCNGGVGLAHSVGLCSGCFLCAALVCEGGWGYVGRPGMNGRAIVYYSLWHSLWNIGEYQKLGTTISYAI